MTLILGFQGKVTVVGWADVPDIDRGDFRRPRAVDLPSFVTCICSFDPTRRMSVVFADDFGVGEGAVDAGGPTKEWLELLMAACRDQHGLFYDTGKGLQLAFNVQGKLSAWTHIPVIKDRIRLNFRPWRLRWLWWSRSRWWWWWWWWRWRWRWRWRWWWWCRCNNKLFLLQRRTTTGITWLEKYSPCQYATVDPHRILCVQRHGKSSARASGLWRQPWTNWKTHTFAKLLEWWVMRIVVDSEGPPTETFDKTWKHINNLKSIHCTF